MECEGKQIWPELLGTNGDEAKAIIMQENKNVSAIIVLPGQSVITDFRCDRVWVWVDEKRVVIKVPQVG